MNARKKGIDNMPLRSDCLGKIGKGPFNRNLVIPKALPITLNAKENTGSGYTV